MIEKFLLSFEMYKSVPFCPLCFVPDHRICIRPMDQTPVSRKGLESEEESQLVEEQRLVKKKKKQD